MIRTLIFGAIAGYVGKKLYDEGKLTEFKDDIVARYNQAKVDIDEKRATTGTGSVSAVSKPAGTSAASPLVN